MVTVDRVPGDSGDSGQVNHSTPHTKDQLCRLYTGVRSDSCYSRSRR